MKKTVLLVDDFRISNEYVSQELRIAGYDVVSVQEARSALMVVSARHIDLIITDYNMPGMDGITLTKTIRAGTTNVAVPIFMLSAIKNPEIRNEAYKAGITAWFEKPFNADRILEMIDKAL